MNRRGLIGTLSLSALLLAGCGRDSGRLAQVSGPAIPAADPANIDLDLLDYEVFTGTLSPGESAVMYNYSTTWGKNCLFSLVVPAESMPSEGVPTTFTMSIPTKSSYLAHPEIARTIIVRMAPDGMRFLGPITIQATWMPWEGAPPSPLYYQSGTEYGVADVQYVPSINRYRVTFDVYHFSDWEVDPVPPFKAPDPISAIYRVNTW